MPKRTKTELLAERGELPPMTLSGTRCIANNKSGTKCKRWAIRGASVCSAHGGAAPQVREAARLRLEGSIDRLLAALVQIALDESQPAAARVAAIKDGLDRSGFGTRDNKLTVEVKPYQQDIEGLLVDVDSDVPFTFSYPQLPGDR
jgi:hypothetical protein